MNDLLSLEFVKKAILNGNVSTLIDDLTEAINEETNGGSQDRLSILYINRSFAKLSLEMPKSAIVDANSAIQVDATSTLAYFIKGLACLWMSNENHAITHWTTGLTHGGPLSYYTIMSTLTSDHNYRTFIFSKKFDVPAIIDIFNDWDKPKVYADSDIQTAYNELRMNSLLAAIAHFNLIVNNDPNNLQALRGRGTAACLAGQWKRAVEDLSVVAKHKLNLCDTLKFRGVALAALGQLSAAIADFTIAIDQVPTDFEALVERAKLQMLRKCYSLAILDFRSVPEQCYTDRIWMYIAECLYAIGDIPKAAEAIASAGDEQDHRKIYCHFLILRDQGKADLALARITRCAELLPSFFFLRTAADFVMDLGCPQEASILYQSANGLKSNDAETRRLMAISLFYYGKEIEACQELVKLSSYAVLETEFVDLCQDTVSDIITNGPLKNFNRSLPAESVLKAASIDAHYFIGILQNIDQEITKVDPEEFPLDISLDVPEENIPKSFTMPELEMTPQIIQMIKDADRIGSRCLPRVPEVTRNVRIIRALGFCVLYYANFLKTQGFTNANHGWKQPFNIMRLLLSYADFRNHIQWISRASADLSPTYYLQKSERRSPRFGITIQSAISRLRAGLNQTAAYSQHHNQDILQLNTLDAIYSVAQSNISQVSTVTIDNFDLQTPTISFRYLGTFGYELYVRPVVDTEPHRKYCAAIQATVTSLMAHPTFTNVPDELWQFMMLFWFMQPLTHYNVELGHVIMHAYVLAANNIELEPLNCSQGEEFIRQMVQPSTERMQTLINEHIKEKSLPQSFSESSLSYWDNIPKCYELFRILDYQNLLDEAK